MNIIIFSKDRPAQLDLLLRSMKKFYSALCLPKVVYRATTPEFKEAYGGMQHDGDYIEEGEFQNDVRCSVGGDPFTQFFVDDDVMIAPFSFDPKAMDDPTVQALSLRMCPTTDYCYTLNIQSGPPILSKDLTWLWPGQTGDWGTPNSVDGNVYRTDDIKGVIEAVDFDCPNRLEPVLRQACRRPLLRCHEKQIVVGIPANSVQDKFPANRNACVDPVEMNRKFLDGQRISLDAILEKTPRAAHMDVDFVWEG